MAAMAEQHRASKPAKICGLSIEIDAGEMEWKTIKLFDNVRQAEDLALTLNNNGINALVECLCGACPYGECEPCAVAMEAAGVIV